MKSVHNSPRNPIGFKVTDNKLMVIENNVESIEAKSISTQEEATIKIAVFIHNLMKKRSTMFVNNEPFCKTEKEVIEDFLNKMYIKYYEPF